MSLVPLPNATPKPITLPGAIVDEPAIGGGVEARIAELIAEIVEGAIGEPDERRVVLGHEVEDGLGITHVRSAPRAPVRQLGDHGGILTAGGRVVQRVSLPRERSRRWARRQPAVARAACSSAA